MSAPDKLIIDTPEQVALEFPLAGAGSRFLAIAMDTALLVGALLAVTIAELAMARTAGGSLTGASTWGAAVLLLAGFALYFGYFAAFETVWRGQTPGKRAVGIRVVSVTGRPLTPFDVILRNLLRLVDQVPGIYAVGVLSVFLTRRNQRLGDLAAGTVVVHEQPIGQPALPSSPQRVVRYGADRLTAGERALVETFLQRRRALDPYVRLQTARQVLARVGARLDLPPGAAEHEERVLEEIVEEYRRS